MSNFRGGFPPPNGSEDRFDSKPEYEVVAFKEKGIYVYYICLKNTTTKIKPEIAYDTKEAAEVACAALNPSGP
ncbi:hypothetical protein [Pantoea sp.]|uniref:hypothetical protein n=1 Tax=Pantoea sp. TaxID=69393 RepID=UPI0028998098|nr:hypothetical protein [Pantoea sp.]